MVALSIYRATRGRQLTLLAPGSGDQQGSDADDHGEKDDPEPGGAAVLLAIDGGCHRFRQLRRALSGIGHDRRAKFPCQLRIFVASQLRIHHFDARTSPAQDHEHQPVFLQPQRLMQLSSILSPTSLPGRQPRQQRDLDECMRMVLSLHRRRVQPRGVYPLDLWIDIDILRGKCLEDRVDPGVLLCPNSHAAEQQKYAKKWGKKFRVHQSLQVWIRVWQALCCGGAWHSKSKDE